MRLCDLTYVQENSILAEPIMDAMGRVLLGAGVRLTVSYIEWLKRLGYQTVYVQDDRLEDVEILSAISDQTLSSPLIFLFSIMRNGMDQAILVA